MTGGLWRIRRRDRYGCKIIERFSPYLELSRSIFLISTDTVPSTLVMNSTRSGFLYSSMGIVISIPVSVVSRCWLNFFKVCGAFGADLARRMYEAAGGRVPVGYVICPPDQQEANGRFWASGRP